MKTLLAAAVLLLLAAPAGAMTWADKGCTYSFVHDEKGFQIVVDGEPLMGSIVAKSKIKWEDGSTSTFELMPNDGVMVDGVELFLVTDNGSICD